MKFIFCALVRARSRESAVKSAMDVSVDCDGEGFRAQALAVAARADGRGHVLHHVLAVALGFGVFEVGAKVGEDAVEAGAREPSPLGGP